MEDASWLTFFKAWRVEIVAWLALLLPGLRALWRRFVKPGTVDIYQTGTLEVGYCTFGATIGLHGTLRARDRDLWTGTFKGADRPTPWGALAGLVWQACLPASRGPGACWL